MLKMLLESARPHRVPLGSLVASVGVHVLLGLPTAWKVTVADTVAPPESFITRALFLPPPDRRPAALPGAERLSWVDIGGAPTGDFLSTDGVQPASLRGDGGTGGFGGGVALAEETTAELTTSALVIGNDTAFSVLEVDETVTRYADSEAPLYPNDLLAQNVEGVVFVRFVVDASGTVDPATAVIVRSTHPHFTHSVLTSLARTRFTPATIDRRPVSQLVEQEFAFRIQPPTTVSDVGGGARATP